MKLIFQGNFRLPKAHEIMEQNFDQDPGFELRSKTGVDYGPNYIEPVSSV